MNRPSFLTVISSSLLSLGISLAALPAAADDNHDHAPAVAAFGRGLNTAQPGNSVNHVMMPKEIKVKAGEVVDFAVAGFHDVVIFKPGFTLADLMQAGGGQFPLTPPIFVIPPNPATPLPAPLAAALNDSIYYRGINPAGGPLATAATGEPSNASNRSEPVSFLERGTYLVICNVRPHLLDGLFGFVKVE